MGPGEGPSFIRSFISTTPKCILSTRRRAWTGSGSSQGYNPGGRRGGGVGKLPSWCGLGTALQEGDTELRPQPEWQLPGSHTILRAEKGHAGPGVQG